MPLQDRAKVGGGWGRVLAGGWVQWLVMLPKVLRQAQDERGLGFFGLVCFLSRTGCPPTWMCWAIANSLRNRWFFTGNASSLPLIEYTAVIVFDVAL